jgi:chromosome segregation ATPase
LPPDFGRAQRDLQQKVRQFREQVVQFQSEKDAFERARLQPTEPQIDAISKAKEIERENLLEERAAEIEHQKQELAKVRQEMADLRRQLYDHYQERRDRLLTMQEDLEKAKLEFDERDKKLRLEEQDAAERRQRDQQRQDALDQRHEELDKRSVELTQLALRFDDDRRQFDEKQKALHGDWSEKSAQLDRRESILIEQTRELETNLKNYEADVLRLNRLQGKLEERDAELQQQANELTRQREQLKLDSAEMEQQLLQLDECQTKLLDETERLAVQKQDQDALDRQLADRSAALEGQQSTMTVLRSRLERMREEIRTREQNLDEQREQQDARQSELTRKQQEMLQLQSVLESEQKQNAIDHEQRLQRSAVMEAAVRQLKQAQEQAGADEQRLRREAQELEERGQQLLEADGILQGRLAQLAETQERLDLERNSLRDRSVNLVQREQACETLQEQLHRRSEEFTLQQKEIADRLQEYQAKFAELEAKQQLHDQREQELNQQHEIARQELERKAEALQKQHIEVTGFEGKYQDQMNQLAVQRKSHAEERAQFHLEQQSTLEKLAQSRAEFETMRREAQSLIQQLPDAELRAGTAMDRLSSAREQLRNHLNEIHQYVRQCQYELEQLRSRLQADLGNLEQQETALRKSQDEHRLATTGFRQQLIDWQGQIAELKRLLARDETRLERRQAQTEERALAIEAESQRLALHAEDLQEQERVVADRRLEMDNHLVDMREWYRHKLRELAGIPLVPDSLGDTRLTILPVPEPTDASDPSIDNEELGIVPTVRSILSISGNVAQGDQKLGQVLRDLQLIDKDTLTALLAEARRQRRSLRQVLLASGVITLYQLALIEAGNVQGLMLGPVRAIDRLRHNAHETVYRIFDPRRGTEAVLRHLSEADMTDAVRPDEFRQRFTQAMLNDRNVANTLEVVELLGRPAAIQEWLSGLPATDWPPLAAAPGVCYRLLTQAAQGLSAAHQAGVVHGHLSDALLLLTGEGTLKICGFGEPPWLSGAQHDEEPTVHDDLRSLGKIVSGWCTPTGVRKGPKTKPLPDALVSVLYRLAAEGETGYRDALELLDDLQKAAAAIPPNSEAWDRLLKYVREHGTAEALLRQSA